MDFPNKLSLEQIHDLERPFTKEEIKGGVWDCGLNKSPGDLVNEVQSAFIANRQILDGPFILNEIIHWCFGTHWRDWIQSSLKSSRGSILVNGSPTPEFQFYKGLKQGHPLSPFLFILVMESLHLSFQKVVNAGLFKGFALDTLLHLSHLFYDDVVFIGQWCDSNITTIIRVLDCFFHASGLRINLHKSKLMVNIGGHMSRINSWDDVINKIIRWLSKWKMKSLSIGGRLTLLKSVLGSTPIYYMSMFKAPVHVLNKLESIRSHFFNGMDPNVRKMTFVKWDNVLDSKEKGGLGVSSFYALNCALILKWVW
ncbi:RNA-directed DNA polymerase, eukaryota, reverse transcriptase zinc-binding domain protein [Tanacetum coccineum]